MRIIALSVLLGVVAYAANAESPLKYVDGQHSQNSNFQSSAVDPVITGVPENGQNLKEWEMRRLKYLECPSCFTAQPFPGQE